jgi:transposase
LEVVVDTLSGSPIALSMARTKRRPDRQDAQLLLRLLIEDRVPRIWVTDAENQDLRRLLWHCHRLVQMRTGDESVACGGTQ